MTGAASPALPERCSWTGSTSSWATPTPFLPAATRARTLAGSRCTPSTCPPTAIAADLPWQWGTAARALVDEHGGIEALCTDLGLTADLVAEVAPRVLAKLENEPIEDLRLDFEDGYGNRADDVEDAEAVRAAAEVAAAITAGEAPAFVGLRFKCFEAPTRRRGIRTLDLFLGTLLTKLEELPDGLVITLPKVSTVSQVEAMVHGLRAAGAGARAAGRPAAVRGPGRDPAVDLGCRWAFAGGHGDPRRGGPGQRACTTAPTTTAPRCRSPRSTSPPPTRPRTSPRR